MSKAKLCLEAIVQGTCNCGNPAHIARIHAEVEAIDDTTAEDYVQGWINNPDLDIQFQSYVNSVLTHYGYPQNENHATL